MNFFNTKFRVDPHQKMIAIIMTQSQPTKSDVTGKFKILTYQALDQSEVTP
ncbi:MAG: hypothetical protein ACNS62_23545 [Candidatus Cyclobacteriaceae bacterium M3_2C_046]